MSDRHELTTPSGLVVATGLELRASALGDNPVLDDSWLMSDADCIAAAKAGFGDLTSWFWWGKPLQQNPKPWCWAFAGGQAVMAKRKGEGHADELLLPDAGPAILGVDSGYPLDWALKRWVEPYGIPPASVAPKLDPFAYGAHGNNPRDWAPDWREQAAARRGVKMLEAPSNRHVRCAVLKGCPCNAGIFWNDSPRLGHALAILAVEHDGRQWWWIGPNSWGEMTSGWFDHPTRKGWFRIPEEKWDVDAFSAWAVVATGWSPQDGTAPAAA